jgi:hypothetical protein
MRKGIKSMLTSKFVLKDLDVVDVNHVIVEMKITKISDRILLSQSHHIERYDDNPMRTLVDVNLHLNKNNDNRISQLDILK